MALPPQAAWGLQGSQGVRGRAHKGIVVRRRESTNPHVRHSPRRHDQAILLSRHQTPSVPPCAPSRPGESDTDKAKAVVEKKAESRIKFSFFAEGGITGNFNDPNDHQNFGRVFDDRANEPLLNQATATLERALVFFNVKLYWVF